MPTWYVDAHSRRLIRKPEITPAPRPFRDQLRDEVYTLIAWAIPAGVAMLVILAWHYRH